MLLPATCRAEPDGRATATGSAGPLPVNGAVLFALTLSTVCQGTVPAQWPKSGTHTSHVSASALHAHAEHVWLDAWRVDVTLRDQVSSSGTLGRHVSWRQHSFSNGRPWPQLLCWLSVCSAAAAGESPAVRQALCPVKLTALHRNDAQLSSS